MHHDAASVAVGLSTCTRSARYRHGVPITVLNSISRDWPFKPWDVGAIPTEPTKMIRYIRLGRRWALNPLEIGSIPIAGAIDAVEPASVGRRPITVEAGSVTQCRYQLCSLSNRSESVALTKRNEVRTTRTASTNQCRKPCDLRVCTRPLLESEA